MKVALLQTDIRWADARRNMSDADRLMDTVPGADLYVLPEMWSTGFATEPVSIAHDEADNSALEWMRRVAGERRCAVSGSLCVRLADQTYRNRHYFVDGRSGTTAFYDKHHLFTYGHEDRYYTAGHDHTMVEFGGFRFLLLTCYDLRFPCWNRYADGLEYDAIILVANWPDSRQSAWQVLTRARAMENQCYLIGVNRVGADAKCTYIGRSVVVGPTGRTLVQCSSGQEEAAVATLDMDELRRRRQKFRVLDDRD